MEIVSYIFIYTFVYLCHYFVFATLTYLCLLMCFQYFLVEPLALLTFLWEENKFNTEDRYYIPVIKHVRKIS